MFIEKYKGNINPDEIVEKIKKARKILVVGHVNPDGDALGSIVLVSSNRNNGSYSRTNAMSVRDFYLGDFKFKIYNFRKGKEFVIKK